MNTLNKSFPWSQSGLELLSTIQQYIDEQGGIANLYQAVMAEIEPEYDTCPTSHSKLTIELIQLYGKVPRQSIPKLLGVSESKVAVMVHELLEAGDLQKEYKGRKCRTYTSKGKDNEKTLMTIPGRKRRLRVKECKRLPVKREKFEMSFD